MSCKYSGCTSLTTITLPNSIKSLSFGIFSGCSSLKFINIPEGVQFIGTSAFNDCINLKPVMIPKSVNRIGTSSFSGCSNLTDVYCYAEQVPNISAYLSIISHELFSNIPQNAVLRVPAPSVKSYRDSEGWNVFKYIVAISDASIREITLSSQGFATFYDSQMG